MKITKPHENIIKIYLDSVSEKPKALKYLLEQGCVKTQYVEPLFMAAPEYLGQLLAKDKPAEGKTYALTGGPKDKCILNGNTWSESEVKV